MKPLRAWVIFAGLALSGCGGESATHPVGGRVSLPSGQPLNVGLVEFLPKNGGLSARGVITPGGGYRLTTKTPDDGAAVGEYIVLVSQPQRLAGSMRPAPEGHDDEHHGGVATTPVRVPRRYARRAESPLRATVEPGENRLDFTLEIEASP